MTDQTFCPSHPNPHCPKKAGEGQCELCGYDFSVLPLDRDSVLAARRDARIRGEQVKNDKTQAKIAELERKLAEVEAAAERERQAAKDAEKERLERVAKERADAERREEDEKRNFKEQKTKELYCFLATRLNGSILAKLTAMVNELILNIDTTNKKQEKNINELIARLEMVLFDCKNGLRTEGVQTLVGTDAAMFRIRASDGRLYQYKVMIKDPYNSAQRLFFNRLACLLYFVLPYSGKIEEVHALVGYQAMEHLWNNKNVYEFYDGVEAVYKRNLWADICSQLSNSVQADFYAVKKIILSWPENWLCLIYNTLYSGDGLDGHKSTDGFGGIESILKFEEERILAFCDRQPFAIVASAN